MSPEPTARGGVAAPAGRAALARRVRARLGAVPDLDEWPPVSIVVLNRNGESHLRTLLPHLASATDYPRLELILVDNASEDGSVELARSMQLPFPLTIVENDENLSFSDANDDGAARAGFDRLLFLNNDVEPFEPGWLKELVACLEGGEAAAVGATLLHGESYRGESKAEYVLQHRGVMFAPEGGSLVPLKVGDGDDLRSWQPADRRTPALTAACLLMRRDDFDGVGGFTTGFQWGWEDVDLGFKLLGAGRRLVCSGRSLLIHHESSTRFREDREWRRRTKAANQRLLLTRWGPQLRREYLLDRFAEGGFWSDGRPPLLAVALGGRDEADLAARELADAVEENGWRVALVPAQGDARSDVPGDADYVLTNDPSLAASLPAALPCIPWVDDRVDAWVATSLLRRAELTLVAHLSTARALEAIGVAPVLLSGAGEAKELTGLLRERAQRLRFCIKLSREWGREPAALTLRRSLEARGHACTLQLADEWEQLGGLTADVAIACGEPGPHVPSPAQLNVLWGPSELRPSRCDQWDLVLVGDGAAARSLAAKTPALVAPLDLDASGDAVEGLLDLVAEATARDSVPASVLAQASATSAA